MFFHGAVSFDLAHRTQSRIHEGQQRKKGTEEQDPSVEPILFGFGGDPAVFGKRKRAVRVLYSKSPMHGGYGISNGNIWKIQRVECDLRLGFGKVAFDDPDEQMGRILPLFTEHTRTWDDVSCTESDQLFSAVGHSATTGIIHHRCSSVNCVHDVPRIRKTKTPAEGTSRKHGKNPSLTFFILWSIGIRLSGADYRIPTCAAVASLRTSSARIAFSEKGTFSPSMIW